MTASSAGRWRRLSAAGGGTAAWVLAEGGLQVMILEEGGDMQGAELTQRDAAMYDQLYVERGGRFTDDMSVTILQGRGLGGGTLVNMSDVVSISDEVYRHWSRSYGLSSFTPERMKPYAEHALDDLGARPIEDSQLNRANRLLMDGAAKEGLVGEIMMHNRSGCAGLGTCMLGCPIGAKRSTRAVAIPRAIENGAEVLIRGRAVRIRRSGQELKEVDVDILDRAGHRVVGTMVVRARIVVLAASAIGSAHLLLRSEIGNEHMGRHLSLQPQLPIVALYDEEIRAHRGIPQAFAITSGFIPDHPRHGLWGYRIEAVMGTPGMAASLLPWPGRRGKDAMAEYDRMAAALALTPDRPTGRIRITPSGRARVEYEIQDDVRARMRNAAKVAVRAYLASGAREVWVPSVPPLRFTRSSDLAKADTLEVGPCRAPLLSAHQQGGVRMSASSTGGAATPEGLVRGTNGVYVVDSGLYPTSASSHTMAPIMTTARMLADGILATHRQASV